MAKYLNYQPMRSLIFVDVVKEQYRHKLQHWLYYHHIPESMAKFEPWVTKYAFYNALPTPPEGERFGTYRMQLTEHYWMVNPMADEALVNAHSEYFPPEVLRWQGTIPDVEDGSFMSGEEARSSGGENGMPPFVYAFLPMFWEKDFKGMGRMMEDGPNYRWLFLLKYPSKISAEEGERWFQEEMLPCFQNMSKVNRILSSQVIQEINDCPFHRCVEMWFDGPEEWKACVDEAAGNLKKPGWAMEDSFPFLKPQFNIASLFLTDIATCDNLKQYRGYLPMR